MPYKIPGIPVKTVKSCALETQVMLGNVKVKKARKPRAKGYKCNREEDRVRPLLAKLLEKDGWILRRVEPHGRYGKKGFNLGDFWGHHEQRNIMAWIESKSMDGELTPGQKKFRIDCKKCRQLYFVVTPADYAVTGYKLESI